MTTKEFLLAVAVTLVALFLWDKVIAPKVPAI